MLGNAGFGLVRSIVSMIYDSILCPYPVLGSNIWFEIKKIIILKGDGGEGLEIPEFRFSGISIILYKQNSKIMTLLLFLLFFFFSFKGNLNSIPSPLLKLFAGHIKMKNPVSRASIFKIGSSNPLSLQFSSAQLFQQLKKGLRTLSFTAMNGFVSDFPIVGELPKH